MCHITDYYNYVIFIARLFKLKIINTCSCKIAFTMSSCNNAGNFIYPHEKLSTE